MNISVVSRPQKCNFCHHDKNDIVFDGFMRYHMNSRRDLL